ncbi:MAG: hypothetical protein K2J85_01815, partial [Anaeroplasmataceae bacterium]|nr:hypothetical protein [Anaeroplasmataceae bacterium]
MIASIIVDIAAKQVNQSFDYMVPSHLEPIIQVGYRVRVVFGRRTVLGFVVELKEKTEFKKKLREISDVVDVYPVLNAEFVELAKFIANHNFSYYAVALQTMIPSALKIKYQKVARVQEIPSELADIFKGKKEILIDNKTPEELDLIYKAHKKGILELDTKFKRTRNEKTIEYVFIKDDSLKPKSKQGIRLLEYLQELEEATPVPMIIENTGFSKSVVDTLVKAGILGSYTKEVLPTDSVIEGIPPLYELNDLQKKAYKALKQGSAKTYLLHGVT